MKEFKVNEYITLKLEDGNTNLYVKEQLFNQCKFLLLTIPTDKINSFNEIESIDEAADNLDNSLEGVYHIDRIPEETEFWGHCSNIKTWEEHNYDTRLLHRNISFALLKKLVDVGDPKAKRVFVEEIAKRLESGHNSVITYLIEQSYIDYIPKEFKNDIFKNIFRNINFLKYVLSVLNDTPHFRKIIEFLIEASGNIEALKDLFKSFKLRDYFNIFKELYLIFVEDEFGKLIEKRLECKIWEAIYIEPEIKPEIIKEFYEIYDEISIKHEIYYHSTFNIQFTIPVIKGSLGGNQKTRKVFLKEFNKRYESKDENVPEINIFQGFLEYCTEDDLKKLLNNPASNFFEIIIMILKKFSFVYGQDYWEEWRKFKYTDFWCSDVYNILGDSISQLLEKWIIKIIKSDNLNDLIFILYDPLINSLQAEDITYLVYEHDLIGNYFKALKNKKDISWLIDGGEKLFTDRFINLFRDYIKERILEIIQENDIEYLVVFIKVNLLKYLDKEDYLFLLENSEIHFLENIIRIFGSNEYLSNDDWLYFSYWCEFSFEDLHNSIPEALSNRLVEFLKNCDENDFKILISNDLLKYIKKEALILLINNAKVPQFAKNDIQDFLEI